MICKHLSQFSLAAISISLLMACSPNETPQQQNATQQVQQEVRSEQSEAERLDAFFAETYNEDLKNSPLTQAYRGIKWDYDKWDDVSPEAVEKRVSILENRLAKAEEFDHSQLTEQQKLSLEIFKEDIKRRLANDEFRSHSYIMHQFRAYHTLVPSFMINIHKVSSVSDAEDYIARLEKVDTLFEQVFEQLKLREEAKIFPPRWSYDQMIQASANVIQGNPFVEAPEDSSLLKDFKQKLNELGLSNAEKSGLISEFNKVALNDVKPAYEKMIEVLSSQREMSPEGDGVWRLPNGEAWYKNRLEWFTTTDLDAEQVHQIGLQEVDRIHSQMQEIMNQVGYEGDLNSFFEFMRTDKQFYYPNTDEGRQQYLKEAKELIDIMEAKIPEYFGLTPKADMIVKRVEAFREQSAGKAFYQSPANDGSRPGIYYANLYDMNAMPIYQMEALAYHEGIPGHHMQRSIAQELQGLPEFQKYVSFTAYTEGWGLYTEELAKDMGFYQDPYSDFGRLAMELWRACRLVVDTGIHSMQWSREQAIDYLIQNTPNPEYDAIKAIERYIAMPGQATAYMIGKLKIMELREKAKAQLGDKFSYADFHDQILMNGPIPLNILERRIDTWIESQK